MMEQIISCEADSRWSTQEIEGTRSFFIIFTRTLTGPLCLARRTQLMQSNLTLMIRFYI